MDRLTPFESVFDVKSNRILDEVPRLLFGISFRVAPLQGRYDGYEAAVLIPFDYNRELVDLHDTALETVVAYKIPRPRAKFYGVLTPLRVSCRPGQ
jgi:hypothetical protein